MHAEDGAPCPALFTTVGNRREQVCRVLEHRARETAWSSGIYRQRTQDALAAVVGLAQLSLREFLLSADLSSLVLTCAFADEENPPDDSRCFVRQAAGLFVDIRADELAEGSMSALGASLGSAIFVSLPESRFGRDVKRGSEKVWLLSSSPTPTSLRAAASRPSSRQTISKITMSPQAFACPTSST